MTDAVREVLDMAEPAGGYFIVVLDPEPERIGLVVAPERHRRHASRLGTVAKRGPECGSQIWPGRRLIVTEHAMKLSKDDHDDTVRICTMMDVQFFVRESECSPPT